MKHLQDAEQLASQLDDPLRRARVAIATSHHFLVTGSGKEAYAWGKRAFDISESVVDLPLKITVNLYFGAACLGAAQFGHAEELLGKTVRMARR